LRASIKSARLPTLHSARADVRIEKKVRPVWFEGKLRETAIYDRGALLQGRKLSGPAVITEYSATTIVPPDRQFLVDGAGNLVIEIGVGDGRNKRRPGSSAS
jgi:N-methylhydantoinase A/oxoprolinase/acetone carboxylase beta subunit